MKRPIITTNEIYHTYNRGVEKRKVFLDDEDHLRFIHDLFEFNDINPAEVRLPKIKREPRKLLIEILAFCLMPNHFHLMIKQKVDGGITLFMRKLGTGYTNYFNRKYKRVGPLFQGKYKLVHLCQDAHFLYLPYYIHLNPVELIEPNWKIKGIKNWSKSKNFLEKYRYSSYLDYIGKKNFPSLTQRDFINEYFENSKEYKKFMQDYISVDDNIESLILE